MIKHTALSAALAAAVIVPAFAAPLKLEVFNPGEAAIFPVASVLVTGDKDAVLVDAQFSRGEAQKLVEKIRASGKKLTTVYISHSDPDYYFGLDVIHAAFPGAKIVATPQTVAGIEKKKDAKVAYWGPILKDNAPKSVIVPQVLKGDTITLEGQSLKIEGLKGVILETYGAGNATTEKWFLDSIHDAIARGIIIFNVSQCDGGRVNQGQYQTSKYLQQVGVVSGSDITAEAAITKMMYIFAKELDVAKSAELLGMSLRGEMTI